MTENLNSVPMFISAKGEPYRLFIHKCPEKEKIAELIEFGFGTVESSPVGENTIVLAAPGFSAGKNEIFSIEYITACCSRSKKLNIKDFRLNKISEFNADFDPMAVLEGTMTWSEAGKYRCGYRQARQSSSSANDDDDGDDGTHMESSGFQLRRQRAYSLAHQNDIVKYVVRHEAYGNVKGTTLWKMMEHHKMCGGRTWQSMKEHFLKKILPAIESFNLTESQITRFKNLNSNNSRRQPKQKQNFNNVIQESSDKIHRTGNSSTNNGEHNNLCNEHPDIEDDLHPFRSLNYYTQTEDEALLKFLAQHKRYKRTGGVRLWKLMERKQVVPDRSWQSMKERYRKVLLQKLDQYLPSDVSTEMLEADLVGTRQRTRKKKVPAAPCILSPQREPVVGISKMYPNNQTMNCTSISNSTNISESSVDSNMLVATSTSPKTGSLQNHILSPKRKLYSQRKSVLEFTPASESQTPQSPECQSAPMVQVQHSTVNSNSDIGCGNRSMRYATVAWLRKKSQHNKDVMTHGTEKSVIAVHNTGHTHQENAACKSGGLFRKQSTSQDSGVLERGGNLLECRVTSETSRLNNTNKNCYKEHTDCHPHCTLSGCLHGPSSSQCNLEVVSGKRTDGERNVHYCHSDSAQQTEDEMVGRNGVSNMSTEEQATVSESRTEAVSYAQGKRDCDQTCENMPLKRVALESKSSKRMLQGHSLIEKVPLEKTLYEHSVEKILTKTHNTVSRKFSQSGCSQYSDVCSCSHDDSLNEEDIALGQKELGTLKLKHNIPDHHNSTGKSSENAGDEREETREVCLEKSTDLIFMQPHREVNDHGAVQGTELHIDDKSKNGSVSQLPDIYQIYMQNACQLSFQEYVRETLHACKRILANPQFELSNCPAIHSIANGNEQESYNGHTQHASEENSVLGISSKNSRPANNAFVGTLLTQQDAVDQPVVDRICSTSQNGPDTCTGYSDKELLVSSSSESECYSDLVPENIIANASKPPPEQHTYCCSSQASMSPSSSLTPEESSHRYKEGFAEQQRGTTSKDADIGNLGHPVSSEHKKTDSCDCPESSTENSDLLASKSVSCSLAASTASTDYSTAVSDHSNTFKKQKKRKKKKLFRVVEDCSFCDSSQNIEPCRQDTFQRPTMIGIEVEGQHEH